MEENKPAIEANAEAIAPQEKSLAPADDAEARVAALEAEKATILEREANYRLAYLKERKKNEPVDPDESEDDRIRRITREELAQNKVTQIDAEKENLLKKLARENKELKLAQLNKTDVPASTTSHSEGQAVKDTLVTPDQEKGLRAKGWDDKMIERYKKNLLKNGAR